MASDVRLIGYDYTAQEHKDVALDPETKALLVKEISPPPTDHGELVGLDDDDHAQYYNQARGDARYLRLAGGTMTGLLTLSGPPTADLHASTKKYVDDKPVGGIDKKNLLVKVNASYPASQVDIDADVLQVEDENLSSINVTVDITQSGANGLDTGSEAANTWYAALVIYNPTTEDIKGLFTTNPDSPTLPEGYTKYRRVGWVRNNGSSNFLKFYQTGDWWCFDARQTVLSTANPATSYTNVDCSSFAPPTSPMISFYTFLRDDQYTFLWVKLRRNGGASDWVTVGSYTSTPRMQTYEVSCPCDNSQIIEYKAESADMEELSLWVLGYSDPI